MLDELFRSEHYGVFAKDRNARFIGANHFLTRAAGFHHSADMFGKSDDDMPWADDFDREIEREVMSSGKIVHHTQRVQGEGKSFFAHTIKLPIYEKDTVVGLVGVFIPFDEDAEPDTSKPTGSAMTVALSYSPRVLVVEDSPLMHQVVRSLLSDLRCIVSIIDSGEAAIAKIQTGHYDVVLMDMGLPNGQGYETAKTISAMGEGQSPVVIGLSAKVNDDILARCKAVGIKETFTKPLMREKMIGVLNQYVYGRTYYDEASREALHQQRAVLYAEPDILDLVTTSIKLGGRFLMLEYFRMLCTYLPEWLIEVRDLCDKRRLGELFNVLHKGKGVLSFVSAPKLHAALEALILRSRGQGQISIDSLYASLSDQSDVLIAVFLRLFAHQNE